MTHIQPVFLPTPYQDSAESGRLILRDGTTATIRLAQAPYLQSTADAPESDWQAEGFAYLESVGAAGDGHDAMILEIQLLKAEEVEKKHDYLAERAFLEAKEYDARLLGWHNSSWGKYILAEFPASVNAADS